MEQWLLSEDEEWPKAERLWTHPLRAMALTERADAKEL